MMFFKTDEAPKSSFIGVGVFTRETEAGASDCPERSSIRLNRRTEGLHQDKTTLSLQEELRCTFLARRLRRLASGNPGSSQRPT
jgi:hypothetical protein